MKRITEPPYPLLDYRVEMTGAQTHQLHKIAFPDLDSMEFNGNKGPEFAHFQADLCNRIHMPGYFVSWGNRYLLKRTKMTLRVRNV